MNAQDTIQTSNNTYKIENEDNNLQFNKYFAFNFGESLRLLPFADILQLLNSTQVEISL